MTGSAFGKDGWQIKNKSFRGNGRTLTIACHMKNLNIFLFVVLSYPNQYYICILQTIGCHLILIKITNAHLSFTKVSWAFVFSAPTFTSFNDA
jgi:hypothetical protein